MTPFALLDINTNSTPRKDCETFLCYAEQFGLIKNQALKYHDPVLKNLQEAKKRIEAKYGVMIDEYNRPILYEYPEFWYYEKDKIINFFKQQKKRKI